MQSSTSIDDTFSPPVTITSLLTIGNRQLALAVDHSAVRANLTQRLLRHARIVPLSVHHDIRTRQNFTRIGDTKPCTERREVRRGSVCVHTPRHRRSSSAGSDRLKVNSGKVSVSP